MARAGLIVTAAVLSPYRADRVGARLHRGGRSRENGRRPVRRGPCQGRPGELRGARPEGPLRPTSRWRDCRFHRRLRPLRTAGCAGTGRGYGGGGCRDLRGAAFRPCHRDIPVGGVSGVAKQPHPGKLRRGEDGSFDASGEIRRVASGAGRTTGEVAGRVPGGGSKGCQAIEGRRTREDAMKETAIVIVLLLLLASSHMLLSSPRIRPRLVARLGEKRGGVRRLSPAAERRPTMTEKVWSRGVATFAFLRLRRVRLTVREIGTGDAWRACAFHAASGATGSEAMT